MDRRLAAAAAVLLAWQGPLAASPEDSRNKASQSLVHYVVVTAARVETPENEVASSITVISSGELARTGKMSLLEALRDVPGLTVLQNGGPGATASIGIRGAPNEHTLVLLDGLELNDPINPSRSFDLAHFPLSQVERVEVLRGPQSPLYGSDALGGVVNIITRKGQGPPRLVLTSSAGSFRTFNGEAALSGSAGRTDYSLGIFHTKTSGISAAAASYPGNVEPDGYRNLSLSGRLGHALGRRAGLSVVVRATRARTEIDNFGGPGGDDPNSIQDYSSFLAKAELRTLSARGSWEQKISAAWIRTSREHLNPADEAHPFDIESGLYRSNLAKFDWQHNLFLHPSNTLTAGLELEREEGQSDYLSESAWGAYDSPFPAARSGTAGLYVQDRWDHRKRLFFTAGIRIDRHSRAGSAMTFRIAPAWAIPETGTKFRATIGTAFKAPSLYQLFAPPTAWGPVGNPALRAERSTGWDAGIDQSLASDRLSIGLSYFENVFRDLIDFDFQEGYVNVGRALTRGVEVSFESRLSESFRLRAGYTHLSARDRGTGEELLRRPRDKFSAEAGGRFFGRVDASASLLLVGRRLDRDFSAFPYATIPLPGYVLVGAVLSAPVGPRLEAFARCDNIFGARYEPVWGYGAPGFSLIGGLRLNL